MKRTTERPSAPISSGQLFYTTDELLEIVETLVQIVREHLSKPEQ